MKSTAYKFKFLVICVLPMLTAQAQTRLRFDSVLQVIREQNPLLKSYEARRDAMGAYAKGGSGWMAPEAGGGLWMVPYRRTEAAQDKGQIMLSVQQTFTNPGKLRATQRYLESKRSIEEANGQVAYHSLKAAAGKTWVQWIVLEKKKMILKESESIIMLMLNLAKARYPNGQGKLGEVYRAEGKLAEVHNLILQNNTEITRKNIELNRWMNVPASVRFDIDTAFLYTPSEGDSAGLSLRRSDIRKIDQTIESFQINAALESAQAKPDFNLSFSHMIPRNSGMPGQFMLLGMVSIPIAPWSAKTYRANHDGIQHEITALKFEREALLTELKSNYAGLQTEISALGEQVRNYEQKIVPVMKRNYEVEMLSYRENKSDLPAVLEAWDAWNASRLLYLIALLNYQEKLVEQNRVFEN